MNSWIHVDSNSDFSIYNIPFGVYSMNAGKPRCASAIGKFIIDLHELQVLGYLIIWTYLQTFLSKAI